MDEFRSVTVRSGDWVVLVDPRWSGAEADRLPPAEPMLGGWSLHPDGIAGPFEPNPDYLPADDSLPTDPVDAVLRLAADGRGDGDDIVAALRAAVVESACDVEGRPLIASAPDDVPCVVVASAAVHRRRVAGRWLPVVGAVLPDIVPARVHILINPGSPARCRVSTAALRVPG
ncbi:type VII secretion system-associated protein [Nocardia sp. NPDC001965]